MNCWPSGKYVHLLYMYSILGRGSFCFNYWFNSAWHGGDQFVALLRWYEAQVSLTVAFRFICIFWSLVSHFPLDNTFTFTFMHLADAFIQSDLQCIQAIHCRDVPIRLRDRKSGPITWFQTRSESDVTSRSGLGYICIYILIIF